MPNSRAAKSSSRSITKTPCWRPAPRKGVTIGLLVKTACEFGVVVGDVVRPEQGTLAVDGHGQAVGCVGAGCRGGRRPSRPALCHPCQRQSPTSGPDPAPGWWRRSSRARSSIHLSGRSSCIDHPGKQHLFRVEHHDLRAKAAADEGRDHPHLVLGEAQHPGQPVADGDGRLGGVPDGQAAGFCASQSATMPRFSMAAAVPRS